MKDALLVELVDIARAASDVILKIYEQDIEVERKKDESPVTEADLAAEALIFERVKQFAPDLAIVAEEAVNRGEVPEASRRFLLVDPLDGTKEFIQKRGDFTVNLGLIEDGSPVAGVVAAPARGEIYAGKVGEGAWLAKGKIQKSAGEPLNWKPIAAKQSDTSALVVVASRSHMSDETKEFIDRFKVESLAQAGSSLKFCLVASGQADIYPRQGRTMEWDTAAGDAVLRSAGGTVQTLDGKPFQYGKRNQASDVDFANPHFVASAFDWHGYLKENT